MEQKSRIKQERLGRLKFRSHTNYGNAQGINDIFSSVSYLSREKDDDLEE